MSGLGLFIKTTILNITMTPNSELTFELVVASPREEVDDKEAKLYLTITEIPEHVIVEEKILIIEVLTDQKNEFVYPLITLVIGGIAIIFTLVLIRANQCNPWIKVLKFLLN